MECVYFEREDGGKEGRGERGECMDVIDLIRRGGGKTEALCERKH